MTAAGRRSLYLGEGGDLSAYEELRVGFTAAVSHELRTPLARLLALLKTASLPGEDPAELLEQGRREVEHMRELIDDVLFLSELETGRTTVFLGLHDPQPVLDEVAEELRESSDRAGVTLVFRAEPGVALPLRPRMLRMVVENLAENALRHAGPGATFTLGVGEDGGDMSSLLLTTAWGSIRAICRVSSSASIGVTVRVLRAGRASVSPS